MASWQAHLTVLGLKLFVKRRNKNVHMDPLAVRAMFDRAPPVTLPGTVVTPATLGGIAGEWVRPVGDPPVGTMFYLHGGGYIACSPRTHRRITSGYALRGLSVFAPAYRLAPEHPFPAALDDVVAAYRGLLASGVAAHRVVFGGDSAGRRAGAGVAAAAARRGASVAGGCGAVLAVDGPDGDQRHAALQCPPRRPVPGDRDGAADRELILPGPIRPSR